MFQKESYTIPSDSSGVYLVKVIEVRRSVKKTLGKVGKFLKISIRHTKPEILKLRKKKKRAIVIRSSHITYRHNNINIRSSDNSLVLLKKRMNTIGRELLGPTTKELKIKKFAVVFKHKI